MMSKDILLQTIPLLPTKFKVDVWLCNDLKALSSHYDKRYAIRSSVFWNNASLNQVSTIEAGMDSLLKGEKRIVMNINRLSHGTIVHECNHIYYHLCKCIHTDANYDSQEWHSYMLEYLFESIINKKNYKKV
jgi:hypothetical protein